MHFVNTDENGFSYRNLYGIEIMLTGTQNFHRKRIFKIDLASCALSSAAVLGTGQYLATLIAQYNDPLLRTALTQHAGI